MILIKAWWAFWFVLRGRSYLANVTLRHAYIEVEKAGVLFEGVVFDCDCMVGGRNDS